MPSKKIACRVNWNRQPAYDTVRVTYRENCIYLGSHWFHIDTSLDDIFAVFDIPFYFGRSRTHICIIHANMMVYLKPDAFNKTLRDLGINNNEDITLYSYRSRDSINGAGSRFYSTYDLRRNVILTGYLYPEAGLEHLIKKIM